MQGCGVVNGRRGRREAPAGQEENAACANSVGVQTKYAVSPSTLHLPYLPYLIRNPGCSVTFFSNATYTSAHLSAKRERGTAQAGGGSGVGKMHVAEAEMVRAVPLRP